MRTHHARVAMASCHNSTMRSNIVCVYVTCSSHGMQDTRTHMCICTSYVRTYMHTCTNVQTRATPEVRTYTYIHRNSRRDRSPHCAIIYLALRRSAMNILRVLLHVHEHTILPHVCKHVHVQVQVYITCT